MSQETIAPILTERRHPRLLIVTRWLQRHHVATITVAAVLMAGVFAFDLLTPADWIAGGFYFVPLALIAVTLQRRAIVGACVVAVLLSGVVMATQHVFADPQHLAYLYLLIVGCGGLVVLSDLLAQLDEVSSRAVRRARLAQAEAEIVGQSNRRSSLHELLENAVRRIGGELEASVGVAFVVRDGEWVREAGYGSTADPQTLCYPYDSLVVLRHALEDNEVLAIHDVRTWFAERRLTPPSIQRLRVAPRARRAAAGLRRRPRSHDLQPPRGQWPVLGRAGRAVPAAPAGMSRWPSRTRVCSVSSTPSSATCHS